MAETSKGQADPLAAKTVIIAVSILGSVGLVVLAFIILLWRRIKSQTLKIREKRSQPQPWLASSSRAPKDTSRGTDKSSQVETYAHPTYETVVIIPDTVDCENFCGGEAEINLATNRERKKAPAMLNIPSSGPITPNPYSNPPSAHAISHDRSPPATSRVPFPAKVLRRNMRAWRARRQTEASIAKSTTSGRTILLRDDTKTRPASDYSDEHRISFFPITPSDTSEHTSSKPASTRSASRRTTLVGLRRQEEPPMPVLAHLSNQTLGQAQDGGHR